MRPPGFTTRKPSSRLCALPTQSMTCSAPPVSCRRCTDRAGRAGAHDGAGDLVGGDDHVGTEHARELALLRMLRLATMACSAPSVAADRGDREQPECAGAENDHGVALIDTDRRARGSRTPSARRSRRPRRSGSSGTACSCALVGDHQRRPAAARCRSRTRSAGRARCGRTRCAHNGRAAPLAHAAHSGLDAASDAAQHGLEHDPVVPSSRSPRPRGRGRTGTRRSARSSATNGRRWWRGRCRRCRRGGVGCAASPVPADRADRRHADAERADRGAPPG